LSRNSLSTFKIGVAIALMAASPALAQTAPPPPTVTVAKPVVRDVIDSDEFIGRFEAVDQVSVRSRIDGYLDTVHFKDGSLVKKGDPLYVQGRLKLDQWEDKEGQKRSKLKVIADNFQFLKGKGGDEAPAPKDQQARQPQRSSAKPQQRPVEETDPENIPF